jgi:hypothetical protein
MSRINVYEPVSEHDYDLDRDAKPRLAGHFDDDKATRIDENREWDGHNMTSVVAGGTFEHECLYRTAGGRWVLNHWSQWEGVQPTYRFVSDAVARDWLLRNGSDTEVAKWFGPVASEAGPDLGGRPEVGGTVSTAVGTDRLAAVDRWAAENGVTRAEAIRRLLDAALGVAA